MRTRDLKTALEANDDHDQDTFPRKNGYRRVITDYSVDRNRLLEW
jgi:hypothetical protein